jgi:HAD superfamily hydrolase (TIGR01549 family)
MHKIVLIFDWDDTLIDIGPSLFQSQYDACHSILQQQEKYPFTKSWQQPSIATLATYIGHRFKETITPSIFAEFNATNTEHQLWQQHLMELFWHNYSLQPKKLFLGIPHMLASLQQNYLLTIATNKSRHLLMDDMGAVSLNHTMFEMIVCGDDAAVSGKFKPHPNMINIIKHNFGNASAFVMVGDRKSDMVAAQNSSGQHLTKTIAIAAADNDFNADYTTSYASDITGETIQGLVDDTTSNSVRRSS